MTELLREVRECRICAAHLPLGPRPVLQAAASARLLIVGQAPGSKVHRSGVPWDDASGERLRAWLGLDGAAFYDESRVAIVPMGLCYPGAGAQGDLPPRPECAPRWHPPLIEAMPRLRLTLLVGQYAQRHYLGRRRKRSLADTVAAFADYAPAYFPLPHPSWRASIFMAKHPWFEAEALPRLRAAVARAMDGRGEQPIYPSHPDPIGATSGRSLDA